MRWFIIHHLWQLNSVKQIAGDKFMCVDNNNNIPSQVVKMSQNQKVSEPVWKIEQLFIVYSFHLIASHYWRRNINYVCLSILKEKYVYIFYYTESSSCFVIADTKIRFELFNNHELTPTFSLTLAAKQSTMKKMLPQALFISRHNACPSPTKEKKMQYVNSCHLYNYVLLNILIISFQKCELMYHEILSAPAALWWWWLNLKSFEIYRIF